jgi:hypothetical protein
MGCGSSSSSADSANAPTIPVSVEAKKKATVNRADYQCFNKTNEVFIRHSGDVKGQMIMIDKCVGSIIFLLDHVGSITMDECTDCVLITGPVSSRYYSHIDLPLLKSSAPRLTTCTTVFLLETVQIAL